MKVEEYRKCIERTYHCVTGMSASLTEGVARTIAEELLEGCDVTIVDVVLIGSCAFGRETVKSDLDFLIYYKGDLKEDAVFNVLHDPNDQPELSGRELDFNPKRLEESGTLEECLQQAWEYGNSSKMTCFTR